MIENHNEFTNFLDLWQEIGLDRTRDSLFLFYHGRRWQKHEFEKTRGWQESQRIFLLDAEVLDNQILDCLECDPRIYYFDSTIIDHPRFFTYLWWFDWVREVEHYQNLTARLIPPSLKNCDMMFDALTGTPRPHKIFVNEMIDSNPKKSNFLIGSRKEVCLKVPDDWVNGGDYHDGSNSPAFYGAQRANIGCFIPYEIYNQTWYSIVAETRGSGAPVFTEKTARPLIARRLFVMFSTHRFLSNLRSLGFETFGDVIDESYDEITDDVDRWTAAWQQVEYLLGQDPRIIYEKIKPILEHNYYMIAQTNHRNSLVQTIKNLVN